MGKGIVIVIAAVALLVVLGIVVAALRRGVGGTRHEGETDHAAPAEGGARRLLTYLLAFVGLLGVLYAAAGLLAVGVATPLLRSSALVSTDDLRSRASFYLAALIVGAPLWWGTWRAAQRRARGSAEERTALERRLFLAAVFAVTSIVVLFGAQTLLQFLLGLPAPAMEQSSAVSAIAAGARLVVYGAAWLVWARFMRAARSALGGPDGTGEAHLVMPAGAGDEAHDLAVYVVSGFSLFFLGLGAFMAIAQIANDLATALQPLLVGTSSTTGWTVWGTIAAWTIAGGGLWGALWRYDTRRGGRRSWRIVYLYAVLLVAVPMTLGGTIDGLYEVLRHLLGEPSGTDDWAFLAYTLPYALVGGAVWAGHWIVLRRQAVLGGPTREEEPAGSVPWPRRPVLALLSLVGLATATPALISLLWLVLDLAFNPRAAVTGPNWWHGQLSLSLSAAAVGLAVWLGAWSVLQEAATAAPARERGAQARRLLVGTILAASTLGAAGFLVAVLWLALQALLGAPGDAGTLSQGLKDLATVLLLGGLAGWSGQVLRGDLRLGVWRTAPRVVALVGEGAHETLAALRAQAGLRVVVAGHLAGGELTASTDPAELGTLLLGLRDTAPGAESVLVVLRPDGVHIYPYAKTAPRPAAAAPPVEAPPVTPTAPAAGPLSSDAAPAGQ